MVAPWGHGSQLLDSQFLVTESQPGKVKAVREKTRRQFAIWRLARCFSIFLVCQAGLVKKYPAAILREKGMVSIALLQKNTTTQYHEEPVNLIYS